MSYKNTWTEDGLLRIYQGDITSKEILNSNISVQTDPRFSEIKYIINDFSNIESFEASLEEINAISAIDYGSSQARNIPSKIAIIAHNETLLQWAGVYLEKMEGSPYIFKILNSSEDAHQWVDEPV